MVDLLFDQFGNVHLYSTTFSAFLNQSNRRSTVQWYFPLKCSLV